MAKNDKPSLGNTENLHQWAMAKVEDGQQMRRPHEAQWWENLATYVGDFWSEFNVHSNRLEEPSKPPHRVRLPVNLAQPAVRTEYSKLLKNRPIVNSMAKSGERKDLNAADVGDKMLNEYGEKKFKKPRVRRRALMWALLTGLGGYFVDYDDTKKQQIPVGDDGVTPITDPERLDEVRQIYRAKHKKVPTKDLPQTELRIVPLSPFQMVWDFSKTYLDEDSTWIIVSEVYDCDEAWRRWGEDLDAESDAMPGVLESRLLGRMDLSGKMQWRPSRQQELVTVHRLFVKPGHRYFKNGAEVVFTKEKVIKATEYPWEHGELPVGMMGHVPFPVTQYPLSVIQQVKPLVLELSKTESQMIENRNLMANAPWIEYVQNRIEGEIENKPGARISVNYVPGVPDPHPVEMPDMPSFVGSLPETLSNHVLEVTGQNETSQGQVPPGARSGVAIAYLTEENDTKLGPTVQEFEECIEYVSWLELQSYAQFYSAPRTVNIYKGQSKGGEPEVFDFEGSMIQESVVGVKVQAGSALPRSLAAKQQFTLDLFDRGLIRNPRTVMEMLDLGQGEKDEWEVDMDQAERENRRMQNGESAPAVEQWHNHQAHLYVHHQLMKSAEFDEMDSDMQQEIEQHESEHQQEVKVQQQQQMAQQMGPGGGGATDQQGAEATGNGITQPPPSGQYSSPDDIGAVSGATGNGTAPGPMDAGPQ